MLKNYNQLTLPAGLVLILTGIIIAIFLPMTGINVNKQWIAFPILLGVSFALFSFYEFWTRITGFAFLLIAFIVFGFAVT